ADGAFYLATTGTDTARLAETAIPWSRLATELAKARGRVLVLLDACRSSAAGSLPLADNDEAVRGLQNALPSGLVVLSASKGRENSVESAELKSGLFTHAVLRAISSDRDTTDLNGNGAIEVSELYRAVRDRVVTLRDGQQTPWLSRSRLVGDFALF
ncbi:MAG: caspase family protein, partial [Rhizobiales bacterium]|nr:caspase family protein [Hyphomicrobiales bacterium]